MRCAAPRSGWHVGGCSAIDLLEIAPGAKDGLKERVRAVTGGHGADVLFDTVGGEWLVDALRSLAFGARMLVVGWAGNTGVAAGGGRGGSLKPDLVPTNLIQIKGLSVMGSPMVISGQRDPASRAARLRAIGQWMEAGVLTPVVSATFAMSSLKQAMAARLGGVVGGCVVRP